MLGDFSGCLSLWANALATRPHLLWQQLFNELSGRAMESSAFTALLAEAERTRIATSAEPWFRLLPRGMNTGTARARLMVSAHTGEARFCALLSTLGAVVTLGDDGAVRLWDQASGAARSTLAQGETGLTCGGTAVGTNLLAAGDLDGQIHLWDLEKCRLLATAEVSLRAVTACALGPGGERLLAGSRDGTLAAYDTSRGTLTGLWTERAGRGAVRACIFSPDGSRTVVATGNGEVCSRDTANAHVLATAPVDAGTVMSMCLHPSGASLLVGVDGSDIQMWDLESLTVRAAAKVSANVLSICASPDGRLIAAGAADGVVSVHDGDSLEYVGEIGRHAGAARSCAFSADGSTVFSVGAEGALKAASVSELGQSKDASPPAQGGTMSCAIDPTDRVAAVATIAGPVTLWSLDNGALISTLRGHAHGTTSCAFDAAGRIYTGGLDRLIRVWDAVSAEELAVWKGHLSSVTSIDITPDASRLLSGDTHGTLRLWSGRGDSLAVAEAHTGMVTSCKVHPAGHIAVSASVDGILLTWDLTSASLDLIGRRRVGEALSLSFGGDGTLLALAGWHGLSAVIKVDDERMCLLPSSASIVRSCALSCDGSVVAYAGWDKLLRVYDLSSGREVAVLITEADLMSCAMNSDGSVFVVGSDWDPCPYIAHLVNGRRGQ
jgi:WD40 repeat protein